MAGDLLNLGGLKMGPTDKMEPGVSGIVPTQQSPSTSIDPSIVPGVPKDTPKLGLNDDL